jgi:NADPH oxidase
MAASKEIKTWDRSAFNGRSEIASKVVDLRWAISRFAHFSKATFFNEHTGPITPFEIGFVTLGAVVAIILTAVSSKTDSGHIAQYMIFIAVLIALKNNALQFTLGVSWERAILMHKCISTVSLVCSCLHGIPQLSSSGAAILQDTKQMSGLIMLLLLGMQPLMYIILRPWNFEVFYYLHLAVYIALVYFAIVHGAGFVLYSIIIFAVDLIIRFFFHSRRMKISVEKKAGNVVQITFEKRHNYHAGQYVFLMIPALGVHEWHPFSISSAPHELLMSLHVGISGDWTQRLADLTLNAKGPIELNAFVEGPYGISAVNFEDATYQIALLISGSIGVTPNQSIANDLLEAHSQGRPMKKIMYVWSMREANLGLVETMRESGQLPGALGNNGDLLQKELNNPDQVGRDNVFQAQIYCTNSTKAINKNDTVIPLNEIELAKMEAAGTVDHYYEKSAVISGRPDLAAIFQRMKELAVSQNERRVAVSVCGPASLVEGAAAACRAITSSEVQFDIQIEKFHL